MKRFFFFFFLAIAVMTHGATTRNDWKVFPMTEAKVQIPLDLVYGSEEFASIAEGLLPESMDDRWVIVVEDGHIFFYRSWTGIMIYDCSFQAKEDGIWIFSMYANRNVEEYKNNDDQHDVLIVKSWLNWLAQK